MSPANILQEHLRTLWRRMTAGGRSATRGIAFVTLLVSLGLAGCKTELYTKLNEREANEMVALLLGHGIEADRTVAKDGSSIVRVEEKRLAHAIDLLKANGFPRQTFTNMGEVFKSSGLIASPTEERARFVYALSEELSRTISDIDGVLSARIHVVLPKNDLLRQDTTPSSASVFIRHDHQAPLKNLLPQIKMLVANSIEGLSYEKVSVVLVPVDRTAASEAVAGRAPVAIAGVEIPGTTGSLEALVPGLGGAALPAALLALAGTVLGAGAAFWFGRRSRAPAPDQAAPERGMISPPTDPRAAQGDGALPPPRRVA